MSAKFRGRHGRRSIPTPRDPTVSARSRNSKRSSLNEGRVFADAEVAATMYKRAIGYEQPAVKIFAPQTPGAETVYAPYLEHYPGDVGAQKSWLFNRQGMRWRDRQEIAVEGSIEHQLARMTPEERIADARELAAQIKQALAEARTIEGEAEEVEE